MAKAKGYNQTRDLSDGCPLMRYLAGLGPVGTLVQVDVEKALTFSTLHTRGSLLSELDGLSKTGRLQYGVDPHYIAVRLAVDPATATA
jgi:hypothetical protein